MHIKVDGSLGLVVSWLYQHRLDHLQQIVIGRDSYTTSI